MPHIFISYAKKDTRQLALELNRALNAVPTITAWVDESLRAGKSWELQIQSEIDRCDYMVVLYSPDINRHKQGGEESYVLTEIAYAKYAAKKSIIPVMAQPTQPPMSLTALHFIDFTMLGLTLDDLVVEICTEMDIDPTSPSTPISVPKNELYMTGSLEIEVKRATPNLPAASLETALQRSRDFKSKSNHDWQPFVTSFYEIDLKLGHTPFCLVPAGSFQMGSDDGFYDDESPKHLQNIGNPYWIGQYPVTNYQWELAVFVGAVKQPYDTGNALTWYKDPAMANAPVVGIDWFMASDFAAWLGCYLPTECEWEYAARGVESWRYTWGDDWYQDIPIWIKNSSGKPADVSTKVEGASWVNAYHLIGNVWEWCSTLHQNYPYRDDDGREDLSDSTNVRVLRGGSWGFDSDYLRAACRNAKSPDYMGSSRGLRVARSVK